METVAKRLAALPDFIPSEQVHGRIGFYGRPREARAGAEGKKDPAAGAWIVIDLGERVAPESVVLWPARVPVAREDEGTGGFPPVVEVEIAEAADFSDAVRLARHEEIAPGAEADLPFLRVAGNGAAGRYLRLRIVGGRARPSGRGTYFSLGEVTVLAGGRNVALWRPVTASESIDNAPRWQAANLTDGFLWCLPLAGRAVSPLNGYHSAIESTGPEGRKWVEVDLSGEAAALPLDEVHVVPAHPRDFADAAGFGFPPRLRVVAETVEGEEVVLLDAAAEDYPNPGAATVMIPVSGLTARRLRVECLRLWPRSGDYIFALAELQAWSGGRNVAAGAPVLALDEVTSPTWANEALTDGFSSRRELLDWPTWLSGLEERQRLEARAAAIRAELDARRGRTIRRSLMAAAVGLVIVLLAAAVTVLWLRRRAERAGERLRARIARDLHDEIGAGLSHLALQSDLAAHGLGADDPARTRFTSLAAEARETLDDMRDIVWLLSPGGEGGNWAELSRRLEAIVGRLLEGTEHEVKTEGRPPAGEPPLEWARHVVAFLKEALTNARRHGNATTVTVVLEWQPGAFRLWVADDGKGFDPEDPALRRGAGLRNLAKRAAELKAAYDLVSSPGKGTVVTLNAPLPKS